MGLGYPHYPHSHSSWQLLGGKLSWSPRGVQGSSNKASLPPFDGPLSALSREETLLVVKIKPVTCLSTIHTKLKKKKEKQNTKQNCFQCHSSVQGNGLRQARPAGAGSDVTRRLPVTFLLQSCSLKMLCWMTNWTPPKGNGFRKCFPNVLQGKKPMWLQVWQQGGREST